MYHAINDVIVGIDLGTTHYSVVIGHHKCLQLVKSDEELVRTPCFVYFPSKNCLHVGDRAKKLENLNGKDGVYDIKSFLGREYHDKNVQALIPRMRYTVEEDLNKLVFVIELPDGTVCVTPTEICSLFLRKIKKDIELELGRNCNVKAVITVPASFNKNQREATLEAAKLANIQVLELLPEPTAIAVRYFSFYKNIEEFEEGDIFLVYNLGRSNFNIAIVKIINNNFDIVAEAKNINLSGQEFDQVIFSYIWNKLDKIYDFSNDPFIDVTLLKRQVQIKSEAIKIQLSTEQKACYFHNYKTTRFFFTSGKVEITRGKFENLAKDLLHKTVGLVNQCLQKNNLNRSLIKKVILYGGLASMPKIQELLSQYFGTTLSNIFVDEHTSVAEGAALYARIL